MRELLRVRRRASRFGGPDRRTSSPHAQQHFGLQRDEGVIAAGAPTRGGGGGSAPAVSDSALLHELMRRSRKAPADEQQQQQQRKQQRPAHLGGPGGDYAEKGAWPRDAEMSRPVTSAALAGAALASPLLLLLTSSSSLILSPLLFRRASR